MVQVDICNDFICLLVNFYKAFSQSQESITVARSLTGGRSRENNRYMTHPSHAHFLLFCEEGLLSGVFLSGGRLITFLGSAFSMQMKID